MTGSDRSGAEILDLLLSHRGKIGRQFGIRRLAIFGSVARGEATPTSDVDVLVEGSSGTVVGRQPEKAATGR